MPETYIGYSTLKLQLVAAALMLEAEISTDIFMAVLNELESRMGPNEYLVFLNNLYSI